MPLDTLEVREYGSTSPHLTFTEALLHFDGFQRDHPELPLPECEVWCDRGVYGWVVWTVTD